MAKRKTYELILMGMLTGILFMGQVLLAFLPNVEIVTFLILLYTLVFGRKVFIMIYTFVLLEGIFYGFGLWWINYLYIWSLLALIVLPSVTGLPGSHMTFPTVLAMQSFAWSFLNRLTVFWINCMPIHNPDWEKRADKNRGIVCNVRSINLYGVYKRMKYDFEHYIIHYRM